MEKTTDQLMTEAAQLLIQAAKQQKEELNYNFNEALGDIIGSIVFHVDAILYNSDKQDEVRPTGTKEFLSYLQDHINSFINQTDILRKHKRY